MAGLEIALIDPAERVVVAVLEGEPVCEAPGSEHDALSSAILALVTSPTVPTGLMPFVL
jgi:hypothetical protein